MSRQGTETEMTNAAGTVGPDLASIAGASYASTDSQDCAAFSIMGMAPECVVFPKSAEQVAAVLEYASKNGLAVIPCRNATKLSLGNRPSKYNIALSLKEMNNVWHYEPSDLTISVEPGMKFGDLQHFVGRDNLWLPLDPEGGTKASMGGLLATNSTGPLRHAYGSPRDITLGMKVATADGKIIKTGGRVVKNVAGYDVPKLIIGSFGTLGVIVEASFKLFPRPTGRASFALGLETFDAARILRRRLMHTSLPLIRMVLLSRQAAVWAKAEAGLESGVTPFELWIETSGSERIMQRVRQDVVSADHEAGARVEEHGGQNVEVFWEAVADFRREAIQHHPEAVIAKAWVPVSRQEEFLSQVERDNADHKIEAVWAFQSGVGSVWIAFLGVRDNASRESLVGGLRQAIRENGGTLVFVESPRHDSAGEPNFWGEAGDDLGMMKRIKQAWDPNNILSPARFLGGI